MLVFSPTDQIGDFFSSPKRIKAFHFIHPVTLWRQIRSHVIKYLVITLSKTLLTLEVFWPTLLVERFQLAIKTSESTSPNLLKLPPREQSQINNVIYLDNIHVKMNFYGLLQQRGWWNQTSTELTCHELATESLKSEHYSMHHVNAAIPSFCSLNGVFLTSTTPSNYIQIIRCRYR